MGAYAVHKAMRQELKNYIETQYFAKSPILYNAIDKKLDEEGVLYQKPFIEASPAYKTIQDGIKRSSLPEWQKKLLLRMSNEDLGVFRSPYVHQIQALENYMKGKDLFVSTGTGSGKTECFMWPIVSKLSDEALHDPMSWKKRGTRIIIMYPMNALVSDQVSRLRRMIGGDEFLSIFHEETGRTNRRPQFGMYTGRTPYPGANTTKANDQDLARTLSKMLGDKQDPDNTYLKELSHQGRIPAKKNLSAFIEKLRIGDHTPDPLDAELITRFEMQRFTPDILITNYSMLELMLLRPREAEIFDDTREWLSAKPHNKLLFIIDEAHMYKGAAGGEVALLIRRLLHRLCIGRDKVQFILTTASMPNTSVEDRQYVQRFAEDLTSTSSFDNFSFLTGEREEIHSLQKFNIPFSKFKESSPDDFEKEEEYVLKAVNQFFDGLKGTSGKFLSLDKAENWMYENILFYKPFCRLLELCRGEAKSLNEIAEDIFPKESYDDKLSAVSTLITIATLARDQKGNVLFPARMHMLFRGINGAYACTNENCSKHHSDGDITLGEIYLSEQGYECPVCHSTVYELYNDRRCGALFFKGYVLTDDMGMSRRTYLWHYPGQENGAHKIKEIHLYIPPKNFKILSKGSANRLMPCYLDEKSGFIDFHDDSLNGKEGIRKLYYSNYINKAHPELISFSKCPHCNHSLSKMLLTSFSTRGNQSFYNLIKTQFNVQPEVKGKDQNPIRLPNQGRKVLLFSDSRQRAARLARDMSEMSDIAAARQLFAVAENKMEKSGREYSLDSLYDFFALAAAEKHVQIFHDEDREKFLEDGIKAENSYQRSLKRGSEYTPRFTLENAPEKMQEFLLRLYSGSYNTLYDSASSWLEPTMQALDDVLYSLESSGISTDDEEVIEVFNAWMMTSCSDSLALGISIPDTARMNVAPGFEGDGFTNDWKFPTVMVSIMNWKENSAEEQKWHRAFEAGFLDKGHEHNEKMYLDLKRIRPRFSDSHEWYRCGTCSKLTPFLLKSKCPGCGSENVHKLSESDYNALSYWRDPIKKAVEGGPIRVIDTEEHTAQLSHKDERDDLWSKTEMYELRFQDLIEENETPVDILSSTTTMEVGIDIGSLVAVGLRNIPPMRENYQQRAGRAGRRGASLSTIVTFCEGGPHDTLYFNDPAPMFRGDPRRPWIDIKSDKLLKRHISIIILESFMRSIRDSLDHMPAAVFLMERVEDFKRYLKDYRINSDDIVSKDTDLDDVKESLSLSIDKLQEKFKEHPELFGLIDDRLQDDPKTLLDALYDEGIIPTFSFPKNVVSMYIMDSYGVHIKYEVQRGLDIAIGEYAPGRSIVVDKATYQIGGLYYPGSERKKGGLKSPARAFLDDPNYNKKIKKCGNCGWFGLADEKTVYCPFCNQPGLVGARPMVKPWGFAPRDGISMPEAQVVEEYSYTLPPQYSTLPDENDMKPLEDSKNIRMVSRKNQRIIMVNHGPGDRGFMICKDCGAIFPGDEQEALKDIKRPYRSKFLNTRCMHEEKENIDLGYDFITDMLVLEIKLDEKLIDTRRMLDNPWLNRASQSLAEALRLSASRELDIEFTELVTGYRIRENAEGAFVDIYLYDNLSSGAGYAVGVAPMIGILLSKTSDILKGCTCRDACFKCLKHYRNQNVHSLLNRFYALQLLEWGRSGKLAPELGPVEQYEMILPIKNILEMEGIRIEKNGSKIFASYPEGRRKEIIVYPSMWRQPVKDNTIYLSDGLLRHFKPYAVKTVENG